jgi:hypothetical protein
MFQDEKVGRRWAVEHFPGTHRFETREVFFADELQQQIESHALELAKELVAKQREQEAADAVQPAPSLSPEVEPPPAPSSEMEYDESKVITRTPRRRKKPETEQ